MLFFVEVHVGELVFRGLLELTDTGERRGGLESQLLLLLEFLMRGLWVGPQEEAELTAA